MTLIITALCKDGIAICSDKRRRIKHSNGKIDYFDDQDKIYKFSNLPLAIFNHGINGFKGKSWNQFCKDYERSGRWRDLSFRELVDDFKAFIEPVILDELRSNKFDHATGFVFCGKTSNETSFQAHELFWSQNFEQKDHLGFVITGDGAKHIDSILKRKPELFSIQYWKEKSVNDAQKELEELFMAATKEQKKAKDQDFSDAYNLETIT